MIRTKRIAAGAWRTLESYWNATGSAFFKAPLGAQVKVRYGVGPFGADRQKHTLDGNHYSKIDIGLASVAYAQIQMKVPLTTDVTYDAYPGGVARPSPEIPF